MLRINSRDIRNLAFAPLGLNITSEQKKLVHSELALIDKSDWYHCSFRNCDLLLLHGGSQVLDKKNMHWSRKSKSLVVTKRVIHSVVEPWFNCLPRIIVLKTQSAGCLNWHIDCNADEINIFQPKLRILVHGNSDDLYYMSRDNSRLKAVTTSDVYYMSGAYIHALENTQLSDRYVICFGSPWIEDNIKSEFLNTLEKQMNQNFIWSEQLALGERANYARDPERHLLIPYA